MVSGKTNEKLDIKINVKIVDRVDTFKYSGLQINDMGYQETEINTIIEYATYLYHSIKNTFIGKKKCQQQKISMYLQKGIFTLVCKRSMLTEDMKNKVRNVEISI